MDRTSRIFQTTFSNWKRGELFVWRVKILYTSKRKIQHFVIVFCLFSVSTRRKKLTKLFCLNKIIYFFLSISFEGISLQKQLSLKKILKIFFLAKNVLTGNCLLFFVFNKKKFLLPNFLFFLYMCKWRRLLLLRRMVGWIHFRHTYTKREQTLYLGWWFNKSFSLRTFETTDSFRRPHKTE